MTSTKSSANLEEIVSAKSLYQLEDSNYNKMSRPEHLFYNGAYILLNDCVAATVQIILYEQMSFNIPGGKYTPDFFVLFSDGSIGFVEVKQEAIARSGRRYYAGRSSYRDSRSKLRATAELNPWFKFFQASYNSRTGWRIETIVPDRNLYWTNRK